MDYNNWYVNQCGEICQVLLKAWSPLEKIYDSATEGKVEIVVISNVCNQKSPITTTYLELDSINFG